MNKIKPLKKFGQNFLVDENVIRKIITEFSPQKDDEIIEIGPGQGALTKHLFNKGFNYSVIEIDTRAAAKIQNDFPGIHLFNYDFLKIDLKKIIKKKARIIGNIPYNITSPIIFKLMENRDRVIDSLLMVQDEVARRINAEMGTKDYGILAILLQNFAEVKYCFKVSPSVFRPVPNVNSAIIHIRWKSPAKLDYSEKIFIQIVKASFAQRRKTVKNSLKNTIFGECDFSEIIDPGLRAERLTIDDFINMAKFFEKNNL